MKKKVVEVDKNVVLNPTKLKAGDLLYILEIKNGSVLKKGDLVTVATPKVGANNYLSVKTLKGSVYNLYYSGPADSFCLASKELRIEAINEKIKLINIDIDAKNKEILEYKKQIEFLEKYETEEDFVADKLDKILQTAQLSKDPVIRTKSIKDILTELKKSDMI